MPLTPDVCSRAVAAIIQKAMEPDPGNRYQSAQEMLEAFRTLGEKDPRTIRYRRAQKITGVAFVTLFLISGAAALVGSKQMGMVQEALALSEYSENALRQGKVSEAVTLALQAVSKKKAICRDGRCTGAVCIDGSLGRLSACRQLSRFRRDRTSGGSVGYGVIAAGKQAGSFIRMGAGAV